MDSKTYIKDLRISPKKLRFLLADIKKLKPSEALIHLYYSPNHASKVFYSSLKSALTNAVNILKVEEQVLRFKHLSVEEGQKLKRFRAGGRGTAKPILKRFAHIKIILEAKEPKKEEIRNPKPEIQNKSKLPKSKLPKKLKKV